MVDELKLPCASYVGCRNSTSMTGSKDTNGFASGRNVEMIEAPSGTVAFDKHELIRLLGNTLEELGFVESAKKLEEESGVHAKDPVFSKIASAVIQGKWLEAISMTENAIQETCGRGASDYPTDAVALLAKEMYFELLEDTKTTQALECLQKQVATRCKSDDVKCLSSYLLLKAHRIQPETQRHRDRAINRSDVVYKLQQLLPKALVVPPTRLLSLLDQAIKTEGGRSQIKAPKLVSLLESVEQCAKDGIDDELQCPSVTVQVLKSHNPKLLPMVHVVFSTSGFYVSSCLGNLVTLHKAKYLETASPFNAFSDDSAPLTFIANLGGHTAATTLSAWSPEDNFLVSGDEDGEILIWKRPDSKCKPLHLDIHKQEITGLVWKDMNKFFSASTEGAIYLIQADGELLGMWTDSPVYALTYSRSYRRIMASCNGTQHIRTITVAKQHHRHYPCEASHSSSSSEDEVDLLINSRDNLIFNLNHVPCSPKFESDWKVSSMAMDQDGVRLFANIVNGNIVEWDVSSGRPTRCYAGGQRGRYVFQAATGGSEERFLACGTVDSSICIWDTKATFEESPKQPFKTLLGHEKAVNSVAWSPDETKSMLISASDDGTMRVWL